MENVRDHICNFVSSAPLPTICIPSFFVSLVLSRRKQCITFSKPESFAYPSPVTQRSAGWRRKKHDALPARTTSQARETRSTAENTTRNATYRYPRCTTRRSSAMKPDPFPCGARCTLGYQSWMDLKEVTEGMKRLLKHSHT